MYIQLTNYHVKRGKIVKREFKKHYFCMHVLDIQKYTCTYTIVHTKFKTRNINQSRCVFQKDLYTCPRVVDLNSHTTVCSLSASRWSVMFYRFLQRYPVSLIVSPQTIIYLWFAPLNS